ncbi:MAG: indole-3-glycerol-phosphate synthase [Deltaproteobacteria bacterium]|nr:indole-3-glycerol-phosphate synthase [Deltaproteobacteria bacterium]
MGFLATILEAKRAEVARLASRRDELAARASEAPAPRDFAGAIRRRGGELPSVIAEVKFRSPSKGPLRERANPGDVVPAWIGERYEAGGARAISVLCDAAFFDGSYADLELVRQAVSLPVLCKEFVIDEVQVDAARAAGADAVLLIARILPGDRLGALAGAVRGRGMLPLVEVVSAAELAVARAVAADVIGVNSRDLDTFEVDPRALLELLPAITAPAVAVGMSGVRTPADLASLARAGADAALVGEHLMRAADPGVALAELLRG